MQSKLKSTVILLTTFALGIALGLVGQGAIQRSRFALPGGRPPGFVRNMEDVLQLRADQQATVRPVLEATAGRNQQLIDATRAQLRTIVDSMAAALAPQLDDAQRKRLDQRIRELPDPFRGPGGRGGPPGPPPGRGPGGPPPGEGPPPR